MYFGGLGLSAWLVLVTLSGALSAEQTHPWPFSVPIGFSIDKVVEEAQSIPSHSWEYGTATEALLELYNPEYSVFGSRPFPVQAHDKLKVRALAYADEKIVIGEGRNALSDGDGAVGDPASLGVAAVMLGKSEAKYANASAEQLDYVVNGAPRWPNGAISHRADYAELWADFIYMAPPFIAFYAADTGNRTLLKESWLQCSRYREVLSSRRNGSDLWKHIVGPVNSDPGHWSTGNAWATAGMTRVLATIMKAPCAERADWKGEAVWQLTSFIKEIIDAVITARPEDRLVRNYVDDRSDDGHGYGELSGTSMFANVIFRMALLAPRTFGPASSKYIQWAENVLVTLGSNDKNGTAHVTDEGIVRPTVNPLNWFDTEPFETGSPEGQGMVTLAYVAHRDCVMARRCRRLRPGDSARSPRWNVKL